MGEKDEVIFLLRALWPATLLSEIEFVQRIEEIIQIRHDEIHFEFFFSIRIKRAFTRVIQIPREPQESQ